MSKEVYLSKSDFLKYLVCPSYLWLWKYKKEVVPEDDDITAQRRMKQGNEVEEWARKLYPEGKMVDEKFNKARVQTEKLVAGKVGTIFQATVFTDKGLLVKADVFSFDKESASWTIREVKSSTQVKKERHHIEDVAFQKAAFEDAGYKTGKTFLVHLNKEYKRAAELNPGKMFIEEDVSEKVDNILPQIRAMAYDALEYLKKNEEPKGCSCRLRPRSQHCPTFHYLNPEVPEYSVFNIARIGKKSLAVLVDDDIFDVREVPQDVKLSAIQRNQVTVAKTKEPIIERKAIAGLLEELEYPLYFLDYETLNLALPVYVGYSPYRQVPFQYSLHILPSNDGRLEHYEYLARSGAQPPEPAMLEHLSGHIGDKGGVVVWNKTFEVGRNVEMAATYPRYSKLLLDMNERVFDLKDIFSKQLFVHHGFNGSNSIKAVLPVLVPEFSYKGMDISSGDVAAIRWYDAISGKESHAHTEQTFESLIKYCGLDTLAMVEIYKKLKSI